MDKKTEIYVCVKCHTRLDIDAKQPASVVQLDARWTFYQEVRFRV